MTDDARAKQIEQRAIAERMAQALAETVARQDVLYPWESRCFCVCHEYPGTYATSESRPCWGCGHVHARGRMLDGWRQGWVGR